MSDKKQTDNPLKILEKLPFIKKLKSIKHIEIIVFVLFLLIILLILFGNGLNISTSSNISSSQTAVSSSCYISTADYLNTLENKLSHVLSNIDGAGNVDVMLSVKCSGEIIYAKDIKTTTDKNSNETITSESIVFVTKNGKSEPLILSEKLPQINGVIIVADGAKDINVKLNLLLATQTLLGLESNQINIFV